MPKTAKKSAGSSRRAGEHELPPALVEASEGFHAMLLRITHEQALPTIDNHQSRHAPTFGCGWSKRTVRVIAQGAKTKQKTARNSEIGATADACDGVPTTPHDADTERWFFFFLANPPGTKTNSGQFSVVYRSHSASGSRGVLVLLVAAITRLGKLLSQVFNLFLILLQLLRTSAGACAVITS